MYQVWSRLPDGNTEGVAVRMLENLKTILEARFFWAYNAWLSVLVTYQPYDWHSSEHNNLPYNNLEEAHIW